MKKIDINWDDFKDYPPMEIRCRCGKIFYGQGKYIRDKNLPTVHGPPTGSKARS